MKGQNFFSIKQNYFQLKYKYEKTFWEENIIAGKQMKGKGGGVNLKGKVGTPE